MAKATGTIAVKNEVPPKFALVKLDDGQGSDYSQVTFIVQASANTVTHTAISGTAAEGTGSSTFYSTADIAGEGGANKYVTLYREGRTKSGYIYFTSMYGDYTKDNTKGDWESLWCTTGSQPIKLEIRDGRSGSIEIDFNYNITSNYTLVQGGTTNKMYRDGYGYHINVSKAHSNASIVQDYIAHPLYFVLDEARRRGELEIDPPTLANSNAYVKVQCRPDTSSAGTPISFRLFPSGASGADTTWQTAAGANTPSSGKLLNKPPFIFATTNNTNASQMKYYTTTAPIKSGSVTYTQFHGDGGSTRALNPSEFAQHWARLINNLPIQISASFSTSNGTGSIALENAVDGTDGNVAISSSFQHSVDIDRADDLTLSGMTGGAALGGGFSIMARTRIGNKLLAVGGVTRDNVASGSIEIGHLNFVAAEGAASWGGALADGDLVPVHDTSADEVRGVELADLKAYMSASVITNLTASGDVLIGDATGDTVNVTGRFISSLVPKTDGLNDLGTNALAWNTVFAESGSFSDNVGIGNNLTVSDTISGSTVSAATLNVGTKATMVHVDVNDSLEVAGYAGFAGTVAISGALSLAGTAVTSTAAEINLLDGSAANTVVGSVAAIYGTTGQLTASALTVGGTISGSATTAHTTTADKVVAKQITTTSLTASGGMTIGDNNNDDLSIIAGLITDLVPQNDSKVDLGSSSKQFAEAHIDTGYIDVITASYARITSLDVDTIVSRTVTKDSLEIKDNLIIAGVSGSVAGDFVGAGFQLGGKVGVQGTGSSPLMSLTLGSRVVTGDALIVNVDGQAGASFASGSDTMAVLGTPGMRFGVTGSISGSLVQAKRIEAGHLALRGAFTATNVSGTTVNAHDFTADDATIGGLQLSSLTASNGVILGSSNADDLSFYGGQITDLIPQNDNKVALGSATKRYTLLSAMSASIAGAVGVVGTVTAGGVTSGGTISGSIVSAATLNVGTKATMVHADINDSLEVAGYAGFAGTVAISGALSLAGTAVTSTAAEINLLDGSAANTVVGSVAAIYGTTGQLTASAITVGGTISGSAVTAHEVTVNKLHGLGIVTQDNLQTGSVLSAAILDSAVITAKINDGAVTAGKIGALAVTKAKINKDVIQNNADAHGGLVYTSGRLSVGWRKNIFVRADGSNISGSVPTKGMFATHAKGTPYTTASLAAIPQSGTLMVYLNGILLHGEHDLGDSNKTGSSAPHADYRVNSGSGTGSQWKIFMNEGLALDSDDILTVTFLSGSGVA